ncbi:AMP-binding protein [Larkinella soli]|uniref:AMP-binding protein n=1 Tax=Larkinella soli TaxID=1770527 RepID=UPI000FFC6101|nr:AMP-binding protein [Larkinella soli]
MQITAGRLPEPKTEYEARAVAFCRAWLSGQATFVLKTSGSTGTPKPITLSRTQMQASAALTGRRFGLAAGDRALVCLNIEYIAGVMMLVRGLELGLDLTIVEPSVRPLDGFDPERDRFAFAAFVPLQMAALLETPEQSLPFLNTMKAVLVGGAAVDRGLENRIQAISAPVFSTYGMTETVSHIAVRQLNGPEKAGEFTVLEGVEIGVDERSCLHITAAATGFRKIQTNDVVDLTGDGRFRLLGRADTIINSGGVKIQPERVEEVAGEILIRAGFRGRFFVYGVPDERLGQRVVLFMESVSLPDGVREELKDAVRREVGPYAVPKQFISVGGFDETPTGKIDKKKISQNH